MNLNDINLLIDSSYKAILVIVAIYAIFRFNYKIDYDYTGLYLKFYKKLYCIARDLSENPRYDKEIDDKLNFLSCRVNFFMPKKFAFLGDEITNIRFLMRTYDMYNEILKENPDDIDTARCLEQHRIDIHNFFNSMPHLAKLYSGFLISGTEFEKYFPNFYKFYTNFTNFVKKHLMTDYYEKYRAVQSSKREVENQTG